MHIHDIISQLEITAPLSYQESYDNAGLITGSPDWQCTGSLLCLDSTEEVISEAISKKVNLVIAHHPILFKGLKKITGRNYVEQAVIKAIKNDIAIYAIHTNLDNVLAGVNGKMADLLGLVNRTILQPKSGTLRKLITFAPTDKAEQVREAIFRAGGGQIGKYSDCSFSVEGTGTFKAGENTDPYVGVKGQRHFEKETRLEVVFPAFMEKAVLAAMIAAHPYEEVAFDIVELGNRYQHVGAGITGDLPEPVSETDFLGRLIHTFELKYLRHSPLLGKTVRKVALCGGSGSFLLPDALATKADFFVTADMKYHEFFDANKRLVIADIGHFESEQFTVNLLYDLLKGIFPTFALLKSETNTNPVNYFP